MAGTLIVAGTSWPGQCTNRFVVVVVHHDHAEAKLKDTVIVHHVRAKLVVVIEVHRVKIPQILGLGQGCRPGGEALSQTAFPKQQP